VKRHADERTRCDLQLVFDTFKNGGELTKERAAVLERLEAILEATLKEDDPAEILRELVACQDLKRELMTRPRSSIIRAKRIEDRDPDELAYMQRKAKAWQRARAFVE
jgi:hypothetical protein